MDTAENGTPVIAGYAVTRLLGRGAASQVWAAVEEATGEAVAIKIADPSACPPGQMRQLAARESAVLERVSSDHVVRLRRTVTLPSGAVALVLDVAEGGSLAALVAGRGRLADGEVVTICTALAAALASLHEAGVVHGDLAAGNVLFTAEGKPLLADFTAARIVGEIDPPLVAGTPGFVAPEVAGGEVPTEASDAYGLGALAWFALTGRARTTGTEPDLAEAVGFLGRRLGPVVAPLLAADPAARPGMREAAVSFYGAAGAVPVSLLDAPADPAAALTRRIRARAQEEGRSTGEPESSAREHVRMRWPWPSVRGMRRRVAATVRPRRRVALAVATVLATVVGVVALVTLWRVAGLLTAQSAVPAATASGGPSPDSPPTPTSANGPPTTPTSTNGTTSADPPARTGSAEPLDLVRADARAVLAALADARAAALTSAEPAQLLRSAAPDSPMHRADTQLLATLGSAGSRYAGLAFSVRAASVLDSPDNASARVRALIDRSAYRVLGPGPQERSVPAEAGAPYVYRLVVVDGQWRLFDIE